MMKNIYGIDSSAPSGRTLFLFNFLGLKPQALSFCPLMAIAMLIFKFNWE